MKFLVILDVDETDFNSREEAHAYVNAMIEKIVSISDKNGVSLNVEELKVI